jgi:hypothetical protein
MPKRPTFAWIERGFRDLWIGFGSEICVLINAFLTSNSIGKAALFRFVSAPRTQADRSVVPPDENFAIALIEHSFGVSVAKL